MVEPHYTTKEVAAQLKVSEKVIYNQIRVGRLRAVMIGTSWRIPESALADFLEAQTGKGRKRRQHA